MGALRSECLKDVRVRIKEQMGHRGDKVRVLVGDTTGGETSPVEGS